MCISLFLRSQGLVQRLQTSEGRRSGKHISKKRSQNRETIEDLFLQTESVIFSILSCVPKYLLQQGGVEEGDKIKKVWVGKIEVVLRSMVT